MFKNILIAVTLAIFSTTALAANDAMSERQFQECMRMSDDWQSMGRSLERRGSKIDEIQRVLRSLEQKLDTLDFQYNIAESGYRGCLSANWGSCNQQAQALDNAALRYNSTLDAYNRLVRKEDRAISEYNKRQRTWKRTVDTYNRRCIGVKVLRKHHDKYCSNSSNKFCEGLK